jgi:hypothetical protein
MINRMRAVIHAGWRIGLATAALVAVATSASAQTPPPPPPPTPQLGLPTQNPKLIFDGSSSSTIKYDGLGSLTVDASAMFLTPKTPTGEQYIMVTVFAGPVAPTGGVCPANYFYVLDALNNLSCYTDFLPDGGTPPFPPGFWGKFQIRTSANPDGTLRESSRLATVADACGVLGGTADFCVQGALLRCINNPGNPSSCYSSSATNAWQFLSPQATPNSTLLSGRIRTTLGYTPFGFNDHYVYPFPITDQFEFVFEVTGGATASMYPTIGTSDPRRFVDVQVAGCGGGFNGVPNCNWSRTLAFSPADHSSLGTGFTDSADGEVNSVVSFPMLVPFDKCNGSIGGKVTDLFSGLGVTSADVQVIGAGNFDVGTGGVYSAPNLCGGGSGAAGKAYTVNVLPPTGYLVSGLGTQTVTVVTDVNGNDSVFPNVNFQLYTTAVDASAYTTFRQAGWGTKPKAGNAGALLVQYFDFLYPNDLTIGGTFTIVETSANAVLDFLPQEGKPVPLKADYVDPLAKPLVKVTKYARRFAHHRKLGSLAGETLALELNVRFSAFGLTRAGLGGLHLATGKLKGYTVDQVLAMANTVLGGGALSPLLKNYDELEDIVEAINENFRAGVVNKGYLIP